MDPARPVRSERSLRHLSDRAPAFSRVRRSCFWPAPKIPHAGRDWSPALCTRHPSRTLSLERDLGVSQRTRQRDVRLAPRDPHALDEWHLQRALGDALADFLEKIGVSAV